MNAPLIESSMPSPEVCARALDARDARFDGVFFVAITTTGIYCRPVCPARVSHTDRRRFFATAAAAERQGYRPCLRCRPELAPGRAPMDAVPRLARVAADRICAGALNGHDVAALAAELGVSERHLRRAMEREIGVSPIELAQTQRLLLAKRLLTDTTLSVTRIAYASGFQSLRRFNALFRERYRLSPSALRVASPHGASPSGPAKDRIGLTLAYRPPLDWESLRQCLVSPHLPGVECLVDGGYCRTVALEGRSGVVVVHQRAGRGRKGSRVARSHLEVQLSPALLPVLMPLLARLRRGLDLDAEPTVIDAHLVQGGLGRLVEARPGLRVPVAFDGFEAVLRAVLSTSSEAQRVAGPLIARLGEAIATEIPGLTHLVPIASRVVEFGVAGLTGLGMPVPQARVLVALAAAMAAGALQLEPGQPAHVPQRALAAIDGVDARLATEISLRALAWPDAFPDSDPALQRAAGCTSTFALRAMAERWCPWRAYAAYHLRLGLPAAARPALRMPSPKPARLRTVRQVSLA